MRLNILRHGPMTDIWDHRVTKKDQNFGLYLAVPEVALIDYKYRNNITTYFGLILSVLKKNHLLSNCHVWKDLNKMLHPP